MQIIFIFSFIFRFFLEMKINSIGILFYFSIVNLICREKNRWMIHTYIYIFTSAVILEVYCNTLQRNESKWLRIHEANTNTVEEKKTVAALRFQLNDIVLHMQIPFKMWTQHSQYSICVLTAYHTSSWLLHIVSDLTATRSYIRSVLICIS